MKKLIVVKLSGHLIKYSDVIKETLSNLKLLSTKASFILVPGGSLFADSVRELQEKLFFNNDIAHWLAIKAMEMYGSYIASLDESSTVTEAYDLSEVYEAASTGKIPILMPYRLMRKFDELPHDWSVTSDSIAVFIASLIKANMVIFAKPINVIVDEHGNVIRRITAKDLRKLCSNIIDPYAAKLIVETGLTTAIYNMLKPVTLRYIMNMEPGDYVLVDPS
ncbi:MAG: hypothetical protein QXD50_03730 [Desulfurococcaceae archaeon]